MRDWRVWFRGPGSHLFLYMPAPDSPPVTAGIKSFRRLVDRSSRFVLTTHLNPDGDGIGSECALALFLASKGKEVVILNPHETPWNYKFLESLFPVSLFEPSRHESTVREADAIIVLDINHLGRLGALAEYVRKSPAKKVCIDHHLDPEEFADLAILDDSSAATAQILYRLLKALDPSFVTQPIATALYAAIMTDTGSFRFPKTDASVHRMVADLLEHGADPTAVYQEVYEHGPLNRLRLLGAMLAEMKTACDGRVVYMVVTRDLFRQTETGEVDTDAFVPYTLSVLGAQIGLMFSELPDCVKVSFRSKGDIPINELAKRFGGNGHRNAAGARITGLPLQEVISRILRDVERFVR